MKRFLVAGFATALMASSAFALSSEKLDELRAKAVAGNGMSQYNLGLIYADPQESIANISEAYVWFSLAADNGAPGKALMIVSNQMTPEQISESKKLLEQRRADLAAHRPIAATPAPAGPVKPAPVVSPVVVSAPVVAAAPEPIVAAKIAAPEPVAVVAVQENQKAKAQQDKAQQAVLGQLKKERDQLAATVATHTNEISALRAAAANFEGERNALKQKNVAASQQSKDASAAELAAANARLKAAESELTKADTNLTDLIATRKALASLKDQLQKLTAENQRLGTLAKQTEAVSDEKFAGSEKARNEINSELLKAQSKLAEATARVSFVGNVSAELSALRQTNTGLTAQLQKLTAERDQALTQAVKASAETQKQLNDLGAKLKTSEETLTKATAAQADLARQVAELKTTKPKQEQETQAQLAKLTAKLEAAQRAAADKDAFQSKLKKAEDELATAASERVDLEQKLKASTKPSKKEAAAQAQVQQLKVQLEAARADSTKTQAAAAAAVTAELEATRKELAAVKAAKPKQEPEGQAQIAKLSEKLEAAQSAAADKDALQSKLKKAEDELATAANERVDLEQKLKASTKPSKKETIALVQVEQLKADLVAVRAGGEKGQTAAADLEKTRKEMAELRGKLKTSSEALAVAQRAAVDKDAFQSKLEKAEDELATAASERVDLEQKLKVAAKPSKKEAAAQAQADQLKADLVIVRADFAKSQAANTDKLAVARKETAELQEKLKATTATLAAAEAAPTAAQEAVPSLKKDLDETQVKLDASLRSYQIQQGEVDRLKSALANIDNERAQIAERLQTATTEAADASSRAAANNDAATQLAAVREQLRQTQNQLVSIAYENAELKHRVSPGSSEAFAPQLFAFNASTPSRPSAAKPDLAVEQPSAPRLHTVALGESLTGIAKRYYGNANRWTEILEANKPMLRTPAGLKAGMKLKIP